MSARISSISYHAVSSTLREAGITLSEDFNALSAQQVEALVYLANAFSYRAPKNAKGPAARHYFYALKRAKARNV